MVLTTHAIVGAAVASVVPGHPVAGFALGFASHFLLDTIPHWDYQLRSSRKDETNKLNNDLVIGRDFFFDAIKITLDFALGFVIAAILFKSFWWGAIGGVLPDLLQFIYFKTRWRLLKPIQCFHLWIHAEYRFLNHPVLGLILQFVIVGIVATLAVYMR